MNEARHLAGWATFRLFLVLAFFCGTTAGAGETNDVPYLESFESYDVGLSILTVDGWSKAAEFSAGARTTTDAGLKTSLAAYTNAGGGLPLSDTHDQFLEVRGDIQNELAGPQSSTVLTDLLMFPEFRLEPPPEPDVDLQLGVYVNSNGLLYFYHQNQTTGTNEWDEIAGGPVVPSNAWIRVRVLKDYANHSFQVRIDEGAAVSDDVGWDAPSGGSQPGSWYRMVQTNDRLSRIILRSSGDTVIDDLVVASSESVIETLSPENISSGQADLRGFLSHTGLSSTAVEVYYGTSDGGTDPASWNVTNVWSSPRPQSLHVFNATGLALAKHFYRFAAVNDFGRIWADDTETFLAYDVTITATDAVAKEEGPETGTFQVSRPGSATGGDVTVNLNIAGTAGNGSDYNFVNDTIIISNGEVNVEITITPLPDLPEGNETVEISIAPDGYGIGTPSTAVVTIVDGPISDLTWVNQSGDFNWNLSSLNWFPPFVGGSAFVNGDTVTFNVSSPGRIYVGSADWNGVDGWSNAVPVDIFPSKITVSNPTFEFEGGNVKFGTTFIDGTGSLVDRNIGSQAFGGGPIYLQGGQFHREIPPDTAGLPGQTFSNNIIVEAESVLDGSRGDNNWLGNLELKGILNLNKSGGGSVSHQNYFTGTLTINQDTNFPGVRGIRHDGSAGNVYLQGPIVDDTNATHTGSYPLKLGSTTLAQSIFLEGPKSYTSDTIVAFWQPASNQNFGVVVEAGSSLGSGDVVVEGTNGLGGARLTINANEAIVGDLTVQYHARVFMNATNDFAGKTLTMEPGSLVFLNTGSNLVDSADLILRGDAKFQIGGGLIETVARMSIDGLNLPSRVYDTSDLPNSIVGAGEIEVIGATPTSFMLLIH
jgi:hypothetical protein